MHRAIIVAMTLLLSCAGARAQASRVALSGATIELSQIALVNPDCTAAGRPVIRVTQQPEHGRLTISNVSIFPYFRPVNPRSDCNWRRVPGVIIKYTSQRGYTGFDSVRLEAFYPNGQARNGAFNINVR